MKMKELEVLIGTGLESRLSDCKYLRSKGQLRKSMESGWQAISINPLAASVPERAKLAAAGHVRIEVVETLYAPYHTYLNLNPKHLPDHATVGFNCDNLIRDDSLIHSFSTKGDSVEDFIERYAVALRIKVFPILDKYSNESELFNGLSAPDPEKWITADRLTRFPVLLAMLVQRGEWDRFETVAEEFLEFCNGRQSQVHRPFAEAMIAGLRSEKGGGRDDELREIR